MSANGADDDAMPEAGDGKAANGIQVISRAAAILRSLREEPDGLSLGQIATRVGLPRSTVQRIVKALIDERFLMAASPTSRVRLGTEILALAQNSKIDMVELAHSHLKLLSDASGETVDLAVLRRDHLVFLDQVAGSHRLRAVSAVGEVFPLYCTANGKACLSLLDDAVVRRLLSAGKLALANGKTRTVDQLLAELRIVRKTGVAFDEEEHFLGISAIGTAFRDRTGTIYAISIPCPTSRFARLREGLVPQLLEVRAKLAEAVGT